ncbi:MAG: hypothetical protein AB7T63_15590 [Planctomycetota bacterium]
MPICVVLMVVLACGLCACGDPPAPHVPAASLPGAGAPPADPKTRARDLAEIMTTIVAAQNANDGRTYLAAMHAFVPTRAEVRSLLREGPATETFLAALKDTTVEDGLRDRRPPNAQQLPPTTRTEVTVHVATTEELAAYERGTVAFAEFPGGMKRFAREVAAPGRACYAVELREPGHDSGTRITAFADLGDRFVLVAKPWRALPDEREADEGP